MHTQRPSGTENLKECCYGTANTYMLLAFVVLISGVSRFAEFATSDGPVLTATYSLPLTANATG